MNEVSIAIKISKFEIEADELTSKLNLVPTHYHYKGDSFIVNTGKGQLEKFYEYNYWEYRVEIRSNEWVQLLIDNFIDGIIVDRKNVLKDLNKESSIEFFVGVNFYNEANPGFHFEAKRLALLSEIGLDLDLDLYNFSSP